MGTYVGTGIRQDVRQVSRVMPPQNEGEHLFTVEAHYRIASSNLDPTDGYHLDRESLVAVIGPSCYWCLATSDDGTPCPGVPG